MQTNKNIDRLFQEKFKDFEVSPSDKVWENIESRLKKTKKSKRFFPFWLRIGSAAAILLLFTIGTLQYFYTSSNNTIITNSDTEITPTKENPTLKNPLIKPIETENIIVTTVENDVENTISKKPSEIKQRTIFNSTEKKHNTNDVINKVTEVATTTNSRFQTPNAQSNQKNTTLEKSPLLKNNNIVAHSTEVKTLKKNLKSIENKPLNSLEKEVVIATTNPKPETQNQKTIPFNKNNAFKNTTSNIAKTTENTLVNHSENQEKNIASKNSIDKTREVATTTNSKLQTPNSKPIQKNNNIIAHSTEAKTLKKSLKPIENEHLNSLEKEEVIATTNSKLQTPNFLKDNLTEDLKKKSEENTKKWSVASIIAPVYYNSFTATGSPLDPQFRDSPKQGNNTVSYGVKVGYKLNKRLTLQSGISRIDVGYKIGNVFVVPGQQSEARLQNVTYTANQTATILNVNASSFLDNLQLETNSPTPVKGSLNQSFGYIEVPLELKYRVGNSSRKLGVSFVGGFSTLFLNNNEVSVETADFSSNLGEANNLNNVNFSGNIGIDIDYKINQKIFLNVAPMLKIHTNTFSENAANFQPYILGVYTGINYKF